MLRDLRGGNWNLCKIKPLAYKLTICWFVDGWLIITTLGVCAISDGEQSALISICSHSFNHSCNEVVFAHYGGCCGFGSSQTGEMLNNTTWSETFHLWDISHSSKATNHKLVNTMRAFKYAQRRLYGLWAVWSAHNWQWFHLDLLLLLQSCTRNFMPDSNVIKLAHMLRARKTVAQVKGTRLTIQLAQPLEPLLMCMAKVLTSLLIVS